MALKQLAFLRGTGKPPRSLRSLWGLAELLFPLINWEFAFWIEALPYLNYPAPASSG